MSRTSVANEARASCGARALPLAQFSVHKERLYLTGLTTHHNPRTILALLHAPRALEASNKLHCGTLILRDRHTLGYHVPRPLPDTNDDIAPTLVFSLRQ